MSFWNLLQVANKKNKDIRLNQAHIKTIVLLWMWYQNIKQSLGAKKNSGCCFKSAQYPINIWIIWLKITCRYWPLNLSPDKGMEAKQVNMKFYLFFLLSFFEGCGGGGRGLFDAGWNHLTGFDTNFDVGSLIIQN